MILVRFIIFHQDACLSLNGFPFRNLTILGLVAGGQPVASPPFSRVDWLSWRGLFPGHICLTIAIGREQSPQLYGKGISLDDC